jgi:hypothetical protein
MSRIESSIMGLVPTGAATGSCPDDGAADVPVHRAVGGRAGTAGRYARRAAA